MSIRSMPSNKKFRDNYDRVFRGRMVLVSDPEPKMVEWSVLNNPSDWSLPKKRKVKK